jgi:hypothetical protein
MGLRVVNFATCKVHTIFPHCNIHKYTWTSLIGTCMNSYIVISDLLRGYDCDIDYYLAVAKSERNCQSVNKQHKMIWRDLILKC